jgi:hypothetical protein
LLSNGVLRLDPLRDIGRVELFHPTIGSATL